MPYLRSIDEVRRGAAGTAWIGKVRLGWDGRGVDWIGKAGKDRRGEDGGGEAGVSRSG